MTATSCPDDGDLLALVAEEATPEDVRAHLEACPACRARLDRLRGEVSSLRMLVPAPAPSATPARCPPLIGKFLVAGILEEDDAVVTYRGIHSLVNEQVAIHLGRSPMTADPAVRQILMASCKPLTLLDHPRIARVQDFDFFEDRPYLVTEYVRGRSLDRYLDHERPTPALAASLTAELARGLAVAHRSGVSHGGITPRSIVIDDAGRPWLTDFGVSRLRGTLPARPDAVGGIPGDSSPGPPGAVTDRGDPQADIAALAGVLDRLLTGKSPRPIDDLGGGRHADHLEPRAPSVPVPLRAICSRAVTIHSTARFADADEFAQALERFIRSRGLPARALTAALILTILFACLWWLFRR